MKLCARKDDLIFLTFASLEIILAANYLCCNDITPSIIPDPYSFYLNVGFLPFCLATCAISYSVIFRLYQIDKLQSSFHQWERISSDPGERVKLTKELLASCESIEWQVNSQFLNHVVCFFYLL